jgi:hypothetical protein
VLVDGIADGHIEFLRVPLEHLFRQPSEEEERHNGGEKSAKEQEAGI